MKRILLSIAIVCGFMGSALAQEKNLTQWVDPMIGTGKMGHVFPGACVPHGIVALSPDTDTIPHNIKGVYQPRSYEYCAGYQYADKTIVGFSHTHFSGTGHSDLGDILVMPATGKFVSNPGTSDDPDSGYRQRFSHSTESAHPGYYAVTLEDQNIRAEMTATQRVGVHRYTFNGENGKLDNPHIILDLIHAIYNYDGKTLWANVRVENDYLVTGYRITNGWARTNYTYFAMEFNRPIKSYGYVEKEKPLYKGGLSKFKIHENFPEMSGRKVVCHFDFDMNPGQELEIKVALSGVSCDGAIKNLKAEVGGKNFAQVQKEADQTWNKELSILQAEGNDDQLTMLYTSLYHTLINPSVYMDVDGQYRGLDHNIHKADGFTNYTIFSLWDTYRALMPLYNIMNRDRSADMAASMIKHYEQSAHKILPVWSHMGNDNFCMIGYHAVPVLADCIATGVKVDKEKAFEAMKSSATCEYYGGLGNYMKLGYVPLEDAYSAASNTFEYAYDDWTIAATAKRLGKSADYDEFIKRSEYYKNSWDSNIQYARARYIDGRYKENFNVLNTHGEGFIEGNAWNYSFYIPHNVPSMMEMFGGEKRFVQKLDSLFTMELSDEHIAHTEDVTREGIMGNYVHGNEVSHHIPYLYAWTKEPSKTQYWVREIMNRMYRNEVEGLCGNDDCGQMSAWYIFTAMGFYPVCPGSGEYAFGAPYLPYMSLDLGNGKKLNITAKGVSDKNRYVKSITLNGEPIKGNFITNEQIMNGGELVYTMTSKKVNKR